MKPALVILAAGMARRYGRLKQIEPVGPGGEAVLDFGIFDALSSGFGEIVVVVRREIEEAIGAHLARGWPDVPVRLALQPAVPPPGGAVREKPWGTGHAVLAAADHVSGPFAVMNADDFYGRRAFEKLGASLLGGEGPSFRVVAWELRKTLSEHGGVSRALLLSDRSGQLARITELVDLRERAGRIQGRTIDGAPRELTGRERVSMNLWGFTPDVFALLGAAFDEFLTGHGAEPEAEFLLSEAINALVDGGAATVTVLPTDEEWMGVTWAEDRPRVARRLAELAAAGTYPVPLSRRG